MEEKVTVSEQDLVMQLNVRCTMWLTEHVVQHP